MSVIVLTAPAPASYTNSIYVTYVKHRNCGSIDRLPQTQAQTDW